MLQRVFVAKKTALADTAQRLLREWREQLGLTSLADVQVWHRYTVDGVSEELFARAMTTIFSEPPVDTWTEHLQIGPQETAFAVELLPGQYDQRADSAEQCLRLLDPSVDARVAYATVYVVTGIDRPVDIVKLKEYVINPIEAREAAWEMPRELIAPAHQPQPVPVLDGFISATRPELLAMLTQYGLAMDEADLAVVQEYFRDQVDRDPTLTELRVLDTYWSDHCRHTTFGTELTHVDIEKGHFTEPIVEAYDWYSEVHSDLYSENPRPQSLMDLATIAVKSLRAQGLLRELDESEEINACTIKIPVKTQKGTEEWLLLFKNETHNHPTEIEPFGGAATCLGGCIRDPLSGRAYVYQAMRVTGSGDPRTPFSETLTGKLPQRTITTQAAAGYSSYGNQIGLATGQVREYYHPGYVAKRMEVGAVVGAVPADQVVRRVPEPGDIVLLVGGRTGRDGIGGATGSSKEHTESSLTTAGVEVQKGNAPTERKLQCLFRRPEASRLIRRCNDFGAGGVAVAVGELADGLTINLDAVPKKYEGLDGTELALSESQERMAVVVAADDADEFCRYADEENLEATPIAVVTKERRLIMQWRGETIVNLERSFLDTNGASRASAAVIKAPAEENYFTPQPVTDVRAAWAQTLGDLNVASQRGLGERFDGTIGAGTVLMPYGGARMCTPVDGMVAKIPLRHGETSTVSIMTHAFDPYLASWSPFHGGLFAVLQSLAKIAALGGNWKRAYLSLQEYFEKLGDTASWGKPVAALLGAFVAQSELEVGAIGGKDSMSGSFLDLHVPPTLISFAVAPGDATHIVSPEWKGRDHALVLLETPLDEYAMPDFEVFIDHADRLFAAAEKGLLKSAQAIDAGGLAAACAKAAFGNHIGARLSDALTPTEWFAARPGSWLVELDREVAEQWALDEHITIIGATAGDSISLAGVTLPLDALQARWEEPLEKVFPTKTLQPAPLYPVSPVADNPTRRARTTIGTPQVVIPVMPGTNCEVDTARAFENAGADVSTVVVRNLTPQALNESVEALVKAVETTQILAFPGGFSAGDEPDGSGKFIAALFRHPALTEAVNDLLTHRDGLILGICNGFQALIKLGLLPYGEIRELAPSAPTLTYNTIGRHISHYAMTKIVSTKSPWLMYFEPGELHRIPFSHGEGRLYAAPDVVQALAANGQIATQYCDEWGSVHETMPANPNGSVAAIEGLLSPNGRILGKMGHSERYGPYVAKNIIGQKKQNIFQAGVDYFTGR